VYGEAKDDNRDMWSLGDKGEGGGRSQLLNLWNSFAEKVLRKKVKKIGASGRERKDIRLSD